jgi:tRNA nucleotidyltransferase (CCA-adding enzyme)
MDKLSLPRIAKDFGAVLLGAGHKAYLVGGATRDMIMGRPASDLDVATDALPSEVIKLYRRVVPTGIEHGTVTVLFQGQSIETTTFREESGFTDSRHPDRVSFGKNILADLSRRDFTMNAIACDLADGRLLDPEGGRADIGQGLIRAIGDPLERFAEDGLRPLRAARFAAQLGFRIDGPTKEAIGQRLDHASKVSMERVRDELCKLLMSGQPSLGLIAMEETGLLALFLPELARCRGVSQEGGYHDFDVLGHLYSSVDGAERRLEIRLAALFHDTGKALTRSLNPDGSASFHGHERESARIAEEVMTRLRFPLAQTKKVRHLVAEHMFHYTEDWGDAAVRRFVARVGVGELEDLYNLRAADQYGMRGRRPDFDSVAALRERVDSVGAKDAALGVRDLAVGGNDLAAIGVPKGPLMGSILSELLEAVMDDPGLNERERLLDIAGKILKART